MTILFSRWSAIVSLFGLFALVSSGCVGPIGGYGYADQMGVDYYEPYGVDYGGWGPGYQVGPFRDGHHRPGGGGERSSGHAYRAAPASHAMPSLPSGARSGGGRGR
jgi:hypothetical protein